MGGRDDGSTTWMDPTDDEDFESDGRMKRRWIRRLHEWCPFGRLLRVNRIEEAVTSRMGVPIDDDRSIQFARMVGRSNTWVEYPRNTRTTTLCTTVSDLSNATSKRTSPTYLLFLMHLHRTDYSRSSRQRNFRSSSPVPLELKFGLVRPCLHVSRSIPMAIDVDGHLVGFVSVSPSHRWEKKLSCLDKPGVLETSRRNEVFSWRVW